MWGCFLMSGVKILHFLKDWWKSIPIHQNYTMALKSTLKDYSCMNSGPTELLIKRIEFSRSWKHTHCHRWQNIFVHVVMAKGEDRLGIEICALFHSVTDLVYVHIHVHVPQSLYFIQHFNVGLNSALGQKLPCHALYPTCRWNWTLLTCIIILQYRS